MEVGLGNPANTGNPGLEIGDHRRDLSDKLRIDLNGDKGANHGLGLSGLRQECGTEPVEGGLGCTDDDSLAVAMKPKRSSFLAAFLGDAYPDGAYGFFRAAAQRPGDTGNAEAIPAPVRSLIPWDISRAVSRLTAP